MTDERADLMLEIFKKLQGEFALMREDLRGMRSEMTSMKQHMAAVMAQQAHQDSEVAMLKLPLGRIEQRLDVVH